MISGAHDGGSARLMREKAERLNRAAQQWERGAEGERRTALVLDALPRDDWTVLHDLAWPGRPLANIDHVAIGPPGVFVIDSKHWTGRISVANGAVRQNGRRRDTAAEAAAESALAIREFLKDLPAGVVQSVLCFVRDDEISAQADGTLLCSTPPSAAAGRRGSGSVGRRGRRGQSPIAALVGASLAIGSVGVLVSNPELLDRISTSLVSFMTDDLGSDQPSEEPPREKRDDRPEKTPAKERRSE